jgi:phosphodiesterase/alkaline phosphatase D-like protein
MPRALTSFGIMIAAARLLVPAATEGAGSTIVNGPEVERVTATSAIIGWTTKDPGGTDLHYAVAHYGTSSQNVGEIAKSPNRRNRSHAEMTFRVLLQGLHPRTTYYYWVESTQANGNTDGPRSRTGQFMTPQGP